MLVAVNLSKHYAGVRALDSVSLSVSPGEIVVVLGPSGGGKTTLLKCLSLLEHPDSGEIVLDGEQHYPRSNGNVPSLHPKVGVVFQNLALWPHLTLRENILLPLRLANGAGDKDYVEQLIDVFGMSPFVNRLPGQVSGGERQRAALVRALALRPSYLLLDEVTSALDVEQVAVVLQELERLKADGVGILLITHLLGFARRAADRFFFLDRGVAVETGGIQGMENPKSLRLKSFLLRAESAS